MEDIRKKFIDQMHEIMNGKDSPFLMTEEKYDLTILRLKAAELTTTKKDRSEYRLLDRFSIVKVGEIEKLVQQRQSQNDPIRYVVPIEQMYDKILEKHVSTGHGGRDRLENELATHYCGITREAIKLFLSLCSQCQLKRKQPKRGLVVKPIVSNQMNSRCQVDLIDMQSQPDGEYRFIFVYQCHLTKFVQIRPLKTKTAEEVSRKLYKVFSIFDAPHILQR